MVNSCNLNWFETTA